MKLCNRHKPYFIAGIVLVMTLFGDSLLLFLGHCLHILFEFIASLLEHGLQAAFGITERQAQIVVFYIGLVIGSWLAWRLSLVVCRKCKECCISLQANANQFLEEYKWLKIGLLLAAFSMSMLFLT